MKSKAFTDSADTSDTPPVDGHELGVLLRTAYLALRRCGNSYFEKFDANGDQFVLLKLLADGGPMNQLELVKRGSYDPSTTTNMLKLLERRGYVIREADPDDGRAKIVRLTAAGRAQQKRIWKASEEVRRELWSCVRSKDRQVVVETLRRIESVMERARADSSK